MTENLENKGWTIDITGYVVADADASTLAADWLIANLSYQSYDISGRIQLDSLRIDDLEELLNWIDCIQKQITVSDFELTDPIRFKYIKRNNIDFIKVIIYNFDQSILSSDIPVPSRELNNFVNKIHKLMIEYPCRCSIHHPYLSNFRLI